MPRIRHRNFQRGFWAAGPRDAIPRDALRQALGVGQYYGSSIRSRWGSRLAVSGVNNIHSLFRFNGKRFVGAGTDFGVVGGTSVTSLLQGRNLTGNPLRFAKGIPTVDTDRTAFPKGPEHLFVVGGALTLDSEAQDVDPLGAGIFKISTTNEASLIGIRPPLAPPIANNGNAVTESLGKSIETFDAGPSGWITDTAYDPGIGLNVENFIIKRGPALRVTVTPDQTVAIQKSVIPTLDLIHRTQFVDSSDQDWIQLFIFCDQPKNLDFIELWFNTDIDGSGTDSIFSYQILVEDSAFSGDTFPGGLADISPFFDDPRPITPEQLRQRQKQKIKAFRKLAPESQGKIITSELASTRLSKTAATWTKLRIPKQDFSKFGEPRWDRVSGMRLTVGTNTGGGVRLIFDEMILHTGTGMMGDYRYAYTYKNSRTGTRSNPSPLNDDDDRPLAKKVERSFVTLTGILQSSDPQVDTLEYWRTLGNGSVLFKIFEQNIYHPITQSLAVFTDTTADYPGLQDKVKTSFNQGDLTRYVQAEELPTDNARFPGSLKDIAGPHFNRMFAIDGKIGERGKLYYSPIGRLEVAEGFVEVTTDDDATQRCLIWNNNIYVFTKSKLYEVTGSDVFFASEIFGVPGTLQPDTVVATPFGIIYQATDGIRVFDGAGTALVSPEPILPLFRGDSNLSDPYSTTPVQFIGKHAAYKDEEYIVSDETDTLAVNLRTGAWRRFGIDATCLYAEPPDRTGDTIFRPALLLASDRVLDFEVPGLTTDAGVAIPFLIETAGTLLEDQSGITKLVQRLYLDFRGGPVTVRARYTAPGGVQTVYTGSLTSRQITEVSLGVPTDVWSVEISGNLIEQLEVFGVEFDHHAPEEGGSLT